MRVPASSASAMRWSAAVRSLRRAISVWRAATCSRSASDCRSERRTASPTFAVTAVLKSESGFVPSSALKRRTSSVR